MPGGAAASADDTKTHRGTFKLYLQPNGAIVVPDLTEPVIPLLRKAGADESLWQAQPCAATSPSLADCRRLKTGLAASDLTIAATADLWRSHVAAMGALRRLRSGNAPSDAGGSAASLLDLKIELASRLLAPCTLCERRCGVDRMKGETGFCGLTDGLQVAAYSMVYNEGPLVGAPTFSVFVRGCSLRCSFCYRPDELRAKGREETPSRELAGILDRAAERGAASWHFLGGNPDESLPSLLRALALTARSLPVVWNSALMLVPEAIELLKGVVDIWLPDFKFGSDNCARQTAGIANYAATITRNLMALRDQDYVVVRHMMISGHSDCCTDVVARFVQNNLAGFRFHTFPCYPRERQTGRSLSNA